jgi:hypothetical protein
MTKSNPPPRGTQETIGAAERLLLEKAVELGTLPLAYGAIYPAQIRKLVRDGWLERKPSGYAIARNAVIPDAPAAPEPTTGISIRLPIALVEKLNADAEAKHVTRSDLIRLALLKAYAEGEPAAPSGEPQRRPSETRLKAGVVAHRTSRQNSR